MMAPDHAKAAEAIFPKSSKMAAPTEPSVVAETPVPDAGLLLYLSQACWDLVLLLPGLMWPGPWSVWCLCPKEQSSGPGQDIAAGGREVPLVTLQDAPAVRSGPATEVEKLLYLWGWEDRQLTARQQGQEGREPGEGSHFT